MHLVEANGSGTTGLLSIAQSGTSSEVKIRGYILNLSPGSHGFHIHESGATGNNCADAGGHFNPTRVSARKSNKHLSLYEGEQPW